MNIINKIIEFSNANEEEVIKLRREIHANPELGFQEYETSKKICEFLERENIDYAKNVAGTGVVAVINGNKKGKTLMLRADMDALPLDENTGLEYSSKNPGVMHACGHDVHTSNLLGVAYVLNRCKDLFNGRIKILFQPAEELGGGGREVLKEGILDDVDFALGLHVDPEKEGKISTNPGYATAYSDMFEIKVKGKNAHSSKPQEGVDAIYIASNILNALYSLNFRNLDPFQVSTFNIGLISGGTAPNIIADELSFKGMMRNITKESRETVKDKIESISKGIAETLGGEAEFIFLEGYPSIYNNEKLLKYSEEVLENDYYSLISDIDKNIRVEDIPNLLNTKAKPRLGAEDFGFYSQKVPSLFMWIGTGAYSPLHSKDFRINEDYIKLMTRIMSYLAIKILNNY